MATTGAGYEKSGDGALFLALLVQYGSQTFLPCLVLKESCFHGSCGLF